MKLDLKNFETKMKKTIETLEGNLSVLRAGRANLSVLSKVNVDYYGVPTPINQMAETKITDAKTITILPWDTSTLKAMEKAILSSEIGITPQNDGKNIRLVFPQPTEERRRELVKQVQKTGEDARVAVRNIRRDANELSKDMKKKSEMTEDELKSSDKSVQELTDKFIKQVDEIVKKKEKEIMEI